MTTLFVGHTDECQPTNATKVDFQGGQILKEHYFIRTCLSRLPASYIHITLLLTLKKLFKAYLHTNYEKIEIREYHL